MTLATGEVVNTVQTDANGPGTNVCIRAGKASIYYVLFWALGFRVLGSRV